MSESFPAEPDQFSTSPEHSNIGRKLEHRYDKLMDERRELLDELKTYNVRDFNAILIKEVVDDKEMKEIRDEWVERVKNETSFLQPLEGLGIDPFSDDLAEQPGFPEAKITFSSKKIHDDYLRSGVAVGGYATRFKPEVEIADPALNVRQRVYFFLKMGSLGPASTVLVHELIHRHHMKSQPEVDGVLTEAHAYYSGLLVTGPSFSMTRTAETLTRPKSGGGLYEYDGSMVIDALAGMASLYAMGKDDAEISDIVSRSAYEWKTGRFEPFETELQNLKEVSGVEDDALDVMALYDLFRLNTFNQRIKAQLLLHRTILDHYSLDELKESNKNLALRMAAVPEYSFDGKAVPAHELMQNVVCPMDDEYPYDSSGIRTGVIFGFFTGEQMGDGADEDDSKPTFGIGRWEAEAGNGSLDIVRGTEAAKPYLDAIRKQSKSISLENKLHVFQNYVGYSLAQSEPLAAEILKALFQSEEEKKKLAHLSEETYGRSFVVMLEELKLMRKDFSDDFLTTSNKKKLQGYVEFLGIMQGMDELLGLNLADNAPAFKEKLEAVHAVIQACQAEISK